MFTWIAVAYHGTMTRYYAWRCEVFDRRQKKSETKEKKKIND